MTFSHTSLWLTLVGSSSTSLSLLIAWSFSTSKRDDRSFFSFLSLQFCKLVWIWGKPNEFPLYSLYYFFPQLGVGLFKYKVYIVVDLFSLHKYNQMYFELETNYSLILQLEFDSLLSEHKDQAFHLNQGKGLHFWPHLLCHSYFRKIIY